MKVTAFGRDFHSPEGYEKDRVVKDALYFQGNTILPIPEITDALDPRILSLVVVDIKTRRIAGLKNYTFEDLMRPAGIPGQYFCRRSFVTWDVLLPTKEQVSNLPEICIQTQSYRLQPEYMGTRRVRITVCNVPANLPGEVMVSYLSALNRIEEMTQMRATAGTA